MLPIVVLAIIALWLSYLAVTAVYGWTEKSRILDLPNERSSHAQPTPRGGGLSIVIITLGVLSVCWLLGVKWNHTAVLIYGIGGAIIAAVSWLDDVRSISLPARLGSHMLAAALVMVGFGFWQAVELPGWGLLHLGWLGIPLTFLWVVGLTNAYSFMDGIDGIAGGQAVVAGFGWAVLGWQSELSLPLILGVLIAATSIGFLSYNWSPASIFMGDVGSVFLGYTFAALAVAAGLQDPRLVLAGILLLTPFIFDSFFTFLRRLFRGENVFQAHRSHLYQRLVLLGYSHGFVAKTYTAIAGMGALLSFLWVNASFWSDFLLPAYMIPACLMLWCFVVWQERKATREMEDKETATA